MPFLTARRLFATFALLALSTAVLAAPANTVAPSIKRTSSHVSTRSVLDITELVPRSSEQSSSEQSHIRESQVAAACRELDIVACATISVIIEPVCDPEDFLCIFSAVLVYLDVDLTAELLAQLELALTANVILELKAILVELGKLTLVDVTGLLDLSLVELKARIQVLLGSLGLSAIVDLLLNI